MRHPPQSMSRYTPRRYAQIWACSDSIRRTYADASPASTNRTNISLQHHSVKTRTQNPEKKKKKTFISGKLWEKSIVIMFLINEVNGQKTAKINVRCVEQKTIMCLWAIWTWLCLVSTYSSVTYWCGRTDVLVLTAPMQLHVDEH